LATVLFARSLGLPNLHPNLVPEILHRNSEREENTYNCPNGLTKLESWCLDAITLVLGCQDTSDPPQEIYQTYFCPPKSYCIGQGTNPVQEPIQSRSASCYYNDKHSKAVKDGVADYCLDFTFAGLGGGLSGEVAVQVVHDNSVTCPPMPAVAELYYKGASYPIQSIPLSQMETQYGSFEFSNQFDATQPLSLCVSGAPAGLSLDWILIPYSSSAQGVSHRSTVEAEAEAEPGWAPHG
jgi:hypothetical protein